MGLPTYASREELAAVADVRSTANIDTQLDRILRAASRGIDKTMHRFFYPVTAAYTFEPRGFTDEEFAEWGFWLERDLLSVSSVTVDGTATTDYTLQSQRLGPPYGQILIAAGDTYVITGEWGYTNDTAPAGTITANLDASETGVGVSDASLVGVGDMITVGSERMIVTGRALTDTTADLAGNLTAVASDDAVPVDDGTLVNQGETITVGSERMLVTAVAGNTLSVVRAVDGSTLAAHTSGDDVYAPRSVTVERDATGSTAATHTSGDTISRHVAPDPIRHLCIAEALTSLEQERAGYVRVIGAGEAAREASGKGIADVRAAAEREYRRYRHGVI